MKLRTFWWLLAALAAVRLVLMATTPVFEPSEARYAAISANMARSGDFVVPRFTHNLHYQSFDGKPPLVFQAGGVFCEMFGVCEFAVRLFPFLSAVLLLLILHYAVKRLSDAETGRLAVLVCASCAAFYAAAGISMTDMTLTCCVAGALLLYRCFMEDFSIGQAAGVAALLGAGMITKGPVALVMFGLPVLADAFLNRRWKGLFNIRWVAVAPVFLLIAVPWFVLVEQRNPGSVWYFFYNENFMRFISHDYGDKYGAGREAFRGVSILWAVVATLPWALLPIVKTVRTLWTGGRQRALEAVRTWQRGVGADFFLLAALAIVGFWCLTSRVLLYYLFPVIPLFAASLALRGDRQLLWKLASRFAMLSTVVVAGALLGEMALRDTTYDEDLKICLVGNRYAYEFRHGPQSEERLESIRNEMKAKREEFEARQKATAEGGKSK